MRVLSAHKIITIFMVTLLLTGCHAAQFDPYTETFFALDTVIDVTLYAEKTVGADTASALSELLEQYESLFSVTDPGSEISAVNSLGEVAVSGDTSELLRGALELCAVTDGALDITLYPLTRAWGFTTEQYRVPSAMERETLLKCVDYGAVELDEGRGIVKVPSGFELDLGAVAKGYIGDKLSEFVESSDVDAAVLNLGGNVMTVGQKPSGAEWIIGVRDPFRTMGQVLTVSIGAGAVVTSGGYQRYFTYLEERYHHILDPSAGIPASSGLAAVTVVADTGGAGAGLVADGLSTAMFVMGLEHAYGLWCETDGVIMDVRVELVFVTDDGTVYITPGLDGRTEMIAEYPLVVLDGE